MDRFIARTALAALVALTSAPPARAANCVQTSVGKTPIDDIGAGLYQGVQGGLYPGGARIRPAVHDAALDRTGRVRLLDADGNPDPFNGRIVLLSIGMSNTSIEFNAFLPKAEADPQKNARVVIVNGAQGGQPAAVIADPTALYWVNVDNRLAAAGVTPLQVEAVWLKQANAGPTEGWTAATDLLRDDLHAIVRIIKTRYPNTRSVYLSSRIYAGYATSLLNPEPYAYESAFAVKWLIEEQLLGSADLNFDPARGPVMAPWLAWGPYLWAAGASKVADLLLRFFKTDLTTRGWFVDCDPADPGTFGAPSEVRDVAVRPAPGGGAEVAWSSLDPVVGAAALYDVVGGSVVELVADGGFARAACLASGRADTPYLDTRPDPATGVANYYIVRGRNSCGVGTWGDSPLVPDPRDELDAGGVACP